MALYKPVSQSVSQSVNFVALDYDRARVIGGAVCLCDVPRLDVLNTANLCPADSVVDLFYLLTVMYTFVWFGTLVHFRCEVY